MCDGRGRPGQPAGAGALEDVDEPAVDARHAGGEKIGIAERRELRAAVVVEPDVVERVSARRLAVGEPGWLVQQNAPGT